MKLRIVLAGVGVILASPVRAQTDSIGSIFRQVLTEVAVASELPRLDSAALLPGVRREIRIYTGFGLGAPHHVVRVAEHTHGVDGQFGVFWGKSNWQVTYSSPAEEQRGRDEARAWDARMRAHIDTAYDCRATKQSRAINVCWLAPRPGRVSWVQLLARLDSLGIDSIPSPVRPKIGLDGWGIVVELRRPTGYRVYSYFMPDSTSADAGERASARVAETVWQAFKHRRAR